MIAAPRKKAFISASTVVYSPKRHMAAAASPYGATLALESPSESAACVSTVRARDSSRPRSVFASAQITMPLFFLQFSLERLMVPTSGFLLHFAC